MKHPDAVDDKPAPNETNPDLDYQAVMGLEQGDVFKSTGKYSRVTKVKHIDYDVTVCDPTCEHPQDARYGEWDVAMGDIYHDWYEGNIVPAELKVVVEEVEA